MNFSGKVYGDDVEPGTAIIIPKELPQYYASCEMEDIDWAAGTNQRKVNELWVQQGKPTDPDNNWAYLEFGGQKRYLIAVKPVFGNTGDYMDVYIQKGDKEEVYPCIMGDAKGTETTYILNGIDWGHVPPGGTDCNVLEIMLKNYDNLGSPTLGSFLAEMTPVTKIVNGGSCFTNPDGPVGLNGKYITGGDGDSEEEEEELEGSETDSFLGVVGSAFREVWVSMCTFMENNIEDRNDSTVLYKFKNVTTGGANSNSSGKGGNTSGDGDIVNACKEVAEMLMDRGCIYSQNNADLISGDIERQLKEGKYFCCATYTTAVLYYSGALTADQINGFNYHYTAGDGIPAMLSAAGWKKLTVSDMSELQPGDVLNVLGDHVMIYGGNNQVWDETAAVTSASGAPTGAPYTTSRPVSSFQVWRKP